MTTFTTKRHIEIDESYQGINLTEFSFRTEEGTSSDQLVETFIKSNHFAYDSLRDCIKREPDKGYLRSAFDINNLKITDFKKKSKEETATFLLDFLNNTNWGDDKNEFTKLLDKYFDFHNLFGDNDFYIISKDWFEKGDARILERESLGYLYYFLIISVDRELNLLTITEWTYD